MCAKLTKKAIKQKRKHLTEDGYSFIITTVQRIHGATLSKRTVDAYLRCEKVPKTGKPRKDVYGILPLFILATDVEAEMRKLKMQTITKIMQA